MNVIEMIGVIAAIAAGMYGALAAGAAMCLGNTLLHAVEKKGSRFPD